MPPISIGLQRDAWGPRFWIILHTLAECSGSQTNLVLSNDEAEAWILLLKSQAHVMPCQLCKNHYLEWIKVNRIDTIRKITGPVRKQFIRTCLWGCHNRINQLNDRPSPDMNLLQLLYPKRSVLKEYEELKTMFSEAIQRQILKYEDVQRWKNCVQRLRNMYGV